MLHAWPYTFPMPFTQLSFADMQILEFPCKIPTCFNFVSDLHLIIVLSSSNTCSSLSYTYLFSHVLFYHFLNVSRMWNQVQTLPMRFAHFLFLIFYHFQCVFMYFLLISHCVFGKGPYPTFAQDNFLLLIADFSLTEFYL